jgi:hypothetical protein
VTASNVIHMVEAAVPGDQTAEAGDFEVVEQTLPATISSTALAPLRSVEAGLAALREKHGGKTYTAIATVKGMQEAVDDRMAILAPIYEIPKVVKAQKAALREVAAELEAFGERVIDELKKIEQPITHQIDAEKLRKKQLKEAAEAKARALAEAGQKVIESIRERITMAVGQTPDAIKELLTVCEAIDGDEALYGEKNGEVLRAKSETCAKLREMHASALQWEEAQRVARETARKAELQSRVDAFSRVALDAIGKSSTEIQAMIAKLEAADITAEQFAERANDALDAQQKALTQLDALLKAAQSTEAAAAATAAAATAAAETKAKAEQLEKQRVEQEQRDKQQADESRRQEEARTALAQQQANVAQAQQSVADQRAAQIAAAVAAIESAPDLLNAEMSVEVLALAADNLRAKKIGVAEFGSKIGAARTAVAAALEKIEAMLSAAKDRACRESEEEADTLPLAAAPAPAPTQGESSQFFGMFASTPAPVAEPAPAAALSVVVAAPPPSIGEALEDALRGLLTIVRDSTGVIGYHADGTVAEWDEFEEVTRAQMALKAADDANVQPPF